MMPNNNVLRFVIADPANIDNLMVKMGNTRFPNMGALYISAYLKQKTDDVACFYLKGEADLPEYLKALESKQAHVFGISFSSWMADLAYRTIGAVRLRFPDIPIICGGTHPTAMPEDVLKKSLADVCVIGEGEQTCLELLEYYAGKRDSIAGIRGIAYRENGSIRLTERRTHFPDLGSLPPADWSIVDFAHYPGLGYCKARPNTAMTFSRGCPFNCVYCSNPVWRCSKPWLRLRPAGDIQQEVAHLYERGIREIWIRADEFNCDLRWTMEVCEAIRALNLTDLYFECNLRADKVTEELAAALKSINVWMINMGIESFNQRVLNGIRKRITVDQVIGACKTLKQQGIDVYAWLMCYQIWEEDGRLCWETDDEVDNTLRTARLLNKQGLIDLMSWQIATPIPGAEMFEVAKKHGCIAAPLQFDVWKQSVSVPGVSNRQVQLHLLKGMLLQSYMAYRKGRLRLSGNVINSAAGRIRYMAAALSMMTRNVITRKAINGTTGGNA